MKRVFLILLVSAFLSAVANAQEKVFTCVVRPYYEAGFKWSYRIDMGELGIYVLKKDGKKVKTRYSYAFLLNTMKQNGWTYVESIKPSEKETYFIFEKKVSSDDEAKAGLELELEEEVLIDK